MEAEYSGFGFDSGVDPAAGFDASNGNTSIGSLLGDQGGALMGGMSNSIPPDILQRLQVMLADPAVLDRLAATQAAPTMQDLAAPMVGQQANPATATPVPTGPAAGTPPLFPQTSATTQMPAATPPVPVNAQGQYDPAPRGNFEVSQQKPFDLGKLLAGVGGLPKPAAPPAAVNPGHAPSVGGAALAKATPMGAQPPDRRKAVLGMTLGQLLGVR